MATFPAPHIIVPTREHKYTLILLHGRDSSGDEFAEEFLAGETPRPNSLTLVQALSNLPVKLVFPSSRMRWSSTFQEEQQAWFDIKSLSFPEEDSGLQVEGIKESVAHLNRVINTELDRVPASRIVLGGISQGMAIGLMTLLQREETFAGFIGMSGWMPFRSACQKVARSDWTSVRSVYSDKLGLDARTTQSTFETPVWLSHTRQDSVVDYGLGCDASETLQHLGLPVKFHTHEHHKDRDHWLEETEGYRDLTAHLNRIVSHQL